VELDLVHGLDLLPGKARGIGQTSVLGDNAFGDAKSACCSLMGEFAHVFKTQPVLDVAHLKPSAIGHAYSSKASEASLSGCAMKVKIFAAGHNNLKASTTCLHCCRSA
jgi:hypothetical protein